MTTIRPPAAERRHRSGNGVAQRIEFGVHGGAQRLEGALGRMTAGAAGRRGDGGVEQLDELAGRGERLAGPPSHDLAGDPLGEPLLAELPQDPRQLPRVDRC